MNEVYQILIQSSEILCLVFGLMGLLIFMLLVFFMDQLTDLSEWFNKEFNIKGSIYNTLNKQIETESIIFSYPRFFGIFIFLISFWAFIFVQKGMDTAALLKAMHVSSSTHELTLVVLKSFTAVIHVFSIAGFVVSIGLILVPKIVRKWCYKLDTWFQTDQFEESLDAMRKDTDQICYLHPIITGVVGLFFSVILLLLAIFNMMH